MEENKEDKKNKEDTKENIKEDTKEDIKENIRGGYDSSLSENTYTHEDLKRMQAWDLNRKIQVSQTRILEWYEKWEGRVYVSFSGGKDSTVLADLTAKVCKVNDYKLTLWFSDTGLEYPEVRQHVKDFAEYLKERYGIEIDLIIDYPKDRKGNRVTFKQVLNEVGYPVISKEVARTIKDARNALDKGNLTSYALKKLNGEYRSPHTGKIVSRYNQERYKFLLDAPFKISNRCCDKMKKSPAHKFHTKSGLYPIIGTMATEGKQRKSMWIKYGCNAFKAKDPSSKPLSFWTEQDVLEYIVKYNLPYASVYGNIVQDEKGRYMTTGLDRTGCMFCLFGAHLDKEPTRFQRLKETHSNIYEYCMRDTDKGGLGLKYVIDWINENGNLKKKIKY